MTHQSVSIYLCTLIYQFKKNVGDIESWIGKHASDIGLLADKLNWTPNRVEDKN